MASIQVVLHVENVFVPDQTYGEGRFQNFRMPIFLLILEFDELTVCHNCRVGEIGSPATVCSHATSFESGWNAKDHSSVIEGGHDDVLVRWFITLVDSAKVECASTKNNDT